jgi:hypothetical protein
LIRLSARFLCPLADGSSLHIIRDGIGNIGEYIASKVFDIKLNQSRSEKGHDGFFQKELVNKKVNVKCYLSFDRTIAMKPLTHPDYYLVLEAKLETQKSSVERPFIIKSIYLFNAEELVSELQQRLERKNKTLKLNEATYVQKDLWEAAEIYPNQRNTDLPMTKKRQEFLNYFSEK